MQDRYVADVGDFGKYGLLRCLTGMTCSLSKPDLNLGVIWYLTPSCHGNEGDGMHLSYLNPKKRPKFEVCDAILYRKLNEICNRITTNENGHRVRKSCYMRNEDRKDFQVGKSALKLIQESDLLPNALDYDKPLCANTDRADWWKGARKKLKGSCDVVFMDPDNGLRVQYGNDCATLLERDESGQKHISKEEICEVLNEWGASAVVIYHHLGRHGGDHDNQIRSIENALTKVAPKGTTIRALRYRRGSSRAFFVLIQKKHHILQSRIDSLAGSSWVQKKHFQIVI